MEQSEQEMEQQRLYIQGMCACRSCPSFVECGEEVGYCHPMAGRSSCITNQMGCVCAGCPIYAQMELTEQYNCTRDPAVVSRGAQIQVPPGGGTPGIGDPVPTDPDPYPGGGGPLDPSIHEPR